MTEDFAPPPTLGAAPERGAVAGAPSTGTSRATSPAGLSPTHRGAGARRPQRSRGVILAWVVGGAAAVAFAGGVIADVALTARQGSLAPVERGFTGRLEGIQAVAGLCLTEVPEGPSVGTLTAVPCAEPHRAETIAALTLDGSWPGDDALVAQATEFCAAQVARAVPAQLRDAVTWRAWVPTQRTWAAGDRSALCVVVADRDLTGSIEAGTAAA